MLKVQLVEYCLVFCARKLVVLDQGNSQTPRLILADMDGKNMEVLATVHRRMITSVTVDRVIDIIYWSEVNDEEASIEMMKLGGRQRKVRIRLHVSV